MLRTRVCAVLGIESPVVQAGMAVFASAELAAAVSNAGGLGIIGGLNRSAEDLREQIERARALTSRPFGVNHVIMHADPDALDATFAARVPVLSLAWGDPGPLVARASAAGTRVVHQVTSAAEAARAAAVGVDVIVGQGTDGGGHIGFVGTMSLLPAVVDAAAGVPVLAAGGIVDGRGLAAALALGAEGVLMGTRFLATPEASIPDSWRSAIVAADETDTVRSGLFDAAMGTSWPGAEVRAIRNPFVAEWEGRVSDAARRTVELRAKLLQALAAADMEIFPAMAGQGCGTIRAIVPAAQVVRDVVAEAERVLRRMSGLVA